jgi:cell division protein FtsB
MRTLTATLLAVFILVLVSPLPSLADTDRFARVQIKKLEERVTALERRVEELETTVQELQDRDKEIEKYTRSNFDLIKELARQLPSEKPKNTKEQ